MRANRKEKSKLCNTVLSPVKSTDDRWIPITKGSNAESVSMSPMRINHSGSGRDIFLRCVKPWFKAVTMFITNAFLDICALVLTNNCTAILQCNYWSKLKQDHPVVLIINFWEMFASGLYHCNALAHKLLKYFGRHYKYICVKITFRLCKYHSRFVRFAIRQYWLG